MRATQQHLHGGAEFRRSDRPEGRAVGGEVFRTGVYLFVADIRTDPRVTRGREQLIARA